MAWYHLWNCSQINVTGLNRWQVNIGSGNGLVPSGNKPLSEPMLTQIIVAYDITRPQLFDIKISYQSATWAGNTMSSLLFLFNGNWNHHDHLYFCICSDILILLQLLQMLTFLKKYLYRQSQYSNSWDSKCLALIAQMVTAFGMNLKVGCSSPPQVDTFSVSKTLTLSQEHPFLCQKWMLLPELS